jgi:hypothetical protein
MSDLLAQLSVALKEWAVVCDALAEGRQIILLRKGGILESAAGFELEHSSFVMFPTYLHQSAAMLKPQYRESIAPAAAEPAKVTLSLAATVHEIHQIASRPQMDRLEAQHIWSPSLIDMRFNYRPENPLYLLVLRVYRLPEPQTIKNTAAYAGCKSWVPLAAPVDCTGASAVMSDDDFAGECGRIEEMLDAS